MQDFTAHICEKLSFKLASHRDPSAITENVQSAITENVSTQSHHFLLMYYSLQAAAQANCLNFIWFILLQFVALMIDWVWAICRLNYLRAEVSRLD